MAAATLGTPMRHAALRPATRFEEPLLVDVPTAARLLGIGRTHAWLMVRRGQMPGVVRLGRSVRVSRDRLEEWVAQQSGKGGQAA